MLQLRIRYLSEQPGLLVVHRLCRRGIFFGCRVGLLHLCCGYLRSHFGHFLVLKLCGGDVLGGWGDSVLELHRWNLPGVIWCHELHELPSWYILDGYRRWSGSELCQLRCWHVLIIDGFNGLRRLLCGLVPRQRRVIGLHGLLGRYLFCGQCKLVLELCRGYV